jgi:hypothetical protein
MWREGMWMFVESGFAELALDGNYVWIIVWSWVFVNVLKRSWKSRYGAICT